MNLWRLDNGRLTLALHAGQGRAWQSERRIIAVLAGTQGGKTTFGPWWLWRETTRRGGGDYIAGTASYDLFKLKMLPALRETFEHILRIGRYWSGDRVIELADPATGRFLARRADDAMWGRIILRSAESGGGLESATARAAWLDEAGMKAFSRDTFEAVLRRLTLHQGRLLLTTTVYDLGWLKQQIYDKWVAGDPTIAVVQFDSTENPTFPRAEFEAARARMPGWQFRMFYQGQFERPAGLIYDCFDPLHHVIPRFPISPTWPRYLGLDFGGVNTVGMFYAAEPGSARLIAYREYRAGGRTAKEHALALLAGEARTPDCVGGSKSEGQWRQEFRAGGLAVREPVVSEVEVGINRVYGVHQRDELRVFSDLEGYLAEKQTYSRVLDADGQPTEAIADKQSFHFMDAERYILSWLRHPPPGSPVLVPAAPRPAFGTSPTPWRGGRG